MLYLITRPAFRKLFVYAQLVAVLFLLSFHTQAQDTVSIYPAKIPNSRHLLAPLPVKPAAAGMVYTVPHPTLELFLPEKATASGSSVIICPGGSYKVLTYEAEGIRTARAFAKNGIAAFVLQYRLPDDSLMTDKKIGPLQDAQQAIKFVREHALQWGLDAKKVGIMGFSAGGHLAATAATHYQKAYIDNEGHTNLRPAFVILVYPVISMQQGLTHADSRKNLLGATPSKETVDYFSNELQVTSDAPPAYITHAGDDKLVDVDNSIQFYESLRHANVPAELHIFPKGGHGFVLRERPEEWMPPIFKWMTKNGLLGP